MLTHSPSEPPLELRESLARFKASLKIVLGHIARMAGWAIAGVVIAGCVIFNPQAGAVIIIFGVYGLWKLCRRMMLRQCAIKQADHSLGKTADLLKEAFDRIQRS